MKSIQTGKARPRNLIPATAILFATLFCLFIGAQERALADPPAGFNWTQTFYDNFSAGGSDSNWNLGMYYMSGSTFEWTETYAPLPEIALYTPGMVSLSANDCTLTSEWNPSTFYSTSCNYTTGSMETLANFEQTYGYFECSMQVGVTQGVDTAFWMFSEPAHREIDIAEFPGAPTVNGGQQAGGDLCNMGVVGGGGGTASNSTFTTQYHTYGCDWEPDVVTWYIDGTQVAQTTSDVPSNPMFLLLSQQMQDDAEDGPYADWFGDVANGSFPVSTNIAYVKVWQHPIPASCTLEGNSTSAVDAADNYHYELGSRFHTNTPGVITGLRALATPNESGNHNVYLYVLNPGTNTVIWTNNLGTWDYSGNGVSNQWVSENLSTPLYITPDFDYIVDISTGTDSGDAYPADQGGFAGGGTNNGYLYWYANSGTWGPEGGGCPLNTYNSDNYCRDVIFQPE